MRAKFCEQRIVLLFEFFLSLILYLHILCKQHLHKYLVALPQRDRPHQAILPVNASEHTATAVSLNASEIRRLIDQQNSKQVVLNEDVYGPLQNDSLVIVIQVCN